jgi:hypothetical protein
MLAHRIQRSARVMPRFRLRQAVLLALVLLARPTFAASGGEQEYLVAMRDGIHLATSVFLPDGDGPWPAIVTRTPYGKDRYLAQATRYTAAGYAFATQDTRGKFKSEGDYFPFETDLPDGYDTVEWIATQPWCNGKVGITGASAMGITGNLAAAADPPHLTAAFVIVAPEGLFNQSRFIAGVFKESHAGGWMKRQGVPEQIPAMKKRVLMDEKWKLTDFNFHRDHVDIPIYNVGGWYDIFLQGNINNFVWLQENGREGAPATSTTRTAADSPLSRTSSGAGSITGSRPKKTASWTSPPSVTT